MNDKLRMIMLRGWTVEMYIIGQTFGRVSITARKYDEEISTTGENPEMAVIELYHKIIRGVRNDIT